LHLTQPALSRQIKSLEDELGLDLLERKANSVQLTESGQVLLREAREVLARADLALERVRSSGASPQLRVGYAPSLASGLLAPAIERFAQVHPRVRIELWDLSSKEMEEGLNKGTLDLVVTVIPEHGKGIAWTQLIQQDIRLAVNRSHPLAGEKSVAAAQLNNQRLLLLCQSEYPEYWHKVQSWFKTHRINAKVAGQYDGISSLIAAVEGGLGAALVVERTAVLPGNVLLKPLKPAVPPVCIGVGVPDARADDPVLQVFVKELVGTAK
jgi:DNA-binding transcriptional LysR family regulator